MWRPLTENRTKLKMGSKGGNYTSPNRNKSRDVVIFVVSETAQRL